MDFAFSEPQEMLQKAAREFLKEAFPDKLLKQVATGKIPDTPELWRKMAEMNWTGLAIPEEYGGVGDFLDLTIMLEEMGRVCFLSPFFATVVLGASAIIEAGGAAQKQRFLPAVAEGKLKLTLALTEASGRYTAEAIQVKATRKSGGFVIRGAKRFVPDAQSADYLICAARTAAAPDPADGITLFLMDSQTPGLTVKPLKTVAGDRQDTVIFDDVKVPAENVLGEIDKGWPYLEKIMAKAAVGRCAEMVGGAGQVLDMTLNYARERTAFGHPIGAFQAMQHRCADMLIDVQSSRFVTYQAAWRLNEGLPAAREVAIAKAWVGQAARRVAHSAHQVHGAIGFTEDYILHYYTKKARSNEFSFGGVDFHLDQLADMVCPQR